VVTTTPSPQRSCWTVSPATIAGTSRLVTPGTITEETLLEAGKANLLLGLAQQGRDDIGAAWLDVSTGLFETAVDPLENAQRPERFQF